MKKLSMKKLFVMFLVVGIANICSATMLMHYNLDETTGTIADDSGTYNNHDGTLNNFNFSAASVVGKYGKALAFDAVDDFIRVDTTDATTMPGDSTGSWGTSFTVSFWTKTSNWSQGGVMACYGKNDVRWTIGLNSGQLAVRARDFGTVPDYQRQISISGINSSLWHHIAVVFNNGTPSLYLDGNNTAELSSTVGWDVNAGIGMQIGRRDYSTKKYYNGTIDDYAVLGEALSSAQVLAIYNSTNPIPEPATIALLTLGFGAVCARRKK